VLRASTGTVVGGPGTGEDARHRALQADLYTLTSVFMFARQLDHARLVACPEAAAVRMFVGPSWALHIGHACQTEELQRTSRSDLWYRHDAQLADIETVATA
jgi:hypothetical protein